MTALNFTKSHVILKNVNVMFLRKTFLCIKEMLSFAHAL
jgi:hypothetical protein